VAQLIEATRMNVLSALHKKANRWYCMSASSPALRRMERHDKIAAKQGGAITPLAFWSPVVALFGRDRRFGECLLLREERKSVLRGPISVFDPDLRTRRLSRR